ncbi:MAG: hypothetical protein EPN86_05880 [Nanoarchaeota archaeon]|nr:MAG: hypothetical protein EPN86_05880 [Nanoarchaeota archaeon]
MPTTTMRGVKKSTGKKTKESSSLFDPSKEDFMTWLKSRKSVLTAKDAAHIKKFSREMRKVKLPRWI